ncbi:MAG: T9SS type A sorting domain-containing protein, partial [Bacteroidales bacterium]
HSIIVKATDESGHIAFDTSIINIEVPVSISHGGSVRNSKILLCYPNPAHSDFSIDLSDIGNSTIEIYNLFGQMVYHTKADKGIHNVNDHGLTSGIYLIKVTDKNKDLYTQKIIIK